MKKKPPYKVRLIHWNKEEAQKKIQILKKAGYEIVFRLIDQAEYRKLLNEQYDAVLIDLTRMPSQGRDLGMALRQKKTTRNIPLIFIEGEPSKVEKIKTLLPDALYSSWDKINVAIAGAIASPPEDPVRPKSIMDAYIGTPLVKKLGIKSNSTLGLIDPPDDFISSLGKLPDNVKVKKRLGPGKSDLIIWFVADKAVLSNDLVKKARSMSEKGGLWIAWSKKGTGVAGDLTQNEVRKIGLDSGLVDYKICSIDKTWSGLLFTRRKKNK
nr:DUF3052 family protein [candidate division Zixibacteria bacterium]